MTTFEHNGGRIKVIPLYRKGEQPYVDDPTRLSSEIELPMYSTKKVVKLGRNVNTLEANSQ